MQDAHSFRILLAGIGADGHCVGLHLLRDALQDCGYSTDFLGVRNTLEAVLESAQDYDVVMLSVMDGHARHYLDGFTLPAPGPAGKTLWYLGGNLVIEEQEEDQKALEALGFDRVFIKFVDLATVMEILAEDLAGSTPRRSVAFFRLEPLAVNETFVSTNYDRLEIADLMKAREEVLASWPTGEAAASLEDNANFLRHQPSLPAMLEERAQGRREILVQPRSGVPDIERQKELFRRFRDAGATVVSYQVDSLTRNNDYQGAAQAIEEHRLTGRESLNGFPVVNHGVDALRAIIEKIGLPLQTRHSTRDPRLLAEISYAGGVSAFEGGAICYNIPYYKDYSLEESIFNWRYVDRLTGLYFERYGIVLDREFFGTLTATLIPPAIPIVTNILESLLAAEQGVRCVSLAYAEQGHRCQDIAAARTMGVLARQILAERGFEEVGVHVVFHQYMAAFPQSRALSEDLIAGSATTAALAGVSRLITKSPAESRMVPTLDDNLRGLEVARRGIADARPEEVDEEAVAREADLLSREVRSIYESVLEIGGDKISEGVIQGFKHGLLDVPFSPSIYSRGEVSTARDAEGAVRFLNVGRLRLPPEVVEFHREKIEERRRASGEHLRAHELVEYDVLQIAREQYDQWPLDSAAVVAVGASRATVDRSQAKVESGALD